MPHHIIKLDFFIVQSLQTVQSNNCISTSKLKAAVFLGWSWTSQPALKTRQKLWFQHQWTKGRPGQSKQWLKDKPLLVFAVTERMLRRSQFASSLQRRQHHLAVLQGSSETLLCHLLPAPQFYYLSELITTWTWMLMLDQQLLVLTVLLTVVPRLATAMFLNNSNHHFTSTTFHDHS